MILQHHSMAMHQRAARRISPSIRAPVSVHPRARRAATAAASSSASSVKLQNFPQSYTELVRQAQASVQAAIQDGETLIEVEFPPSGLASVPGDGEGKQEMDDSMKYLKDFLQGFRSQAATTRVFFPEKAELRVAKYGMGMDPNAGVKGGPGVFGGKSGFQLDYLTVPSLWWELGFNKGLLDMEKKIKPTDKLLIAAYPYFNVQEIVSVLQLWKVARERGIPIVIFNGELDRIRSGYYNTFLVPQVGQVKKELIPNITQAYYLRNIKRPSGCLYRAYPGPWQVMRQVNVVDKVYKTIYTSDTMPPLPKVALDILPNPKYQ